MRVGEGRSGRGGRDEEHVSLKYRFLASNLVSRVTRLTFAGILELRTM